MDNTDLITKARELCDAATSGPWKNPWDSDAENNNAIESPDGAGVVSATWVDGPQLVVSVHNAAFIATSRTLVPQLCDALEAAQKELIDYHHTQKTADGKMAENARLRRINEQLTARAEIAEAERDTYRAALENWHEDGQEAGNRWIPVGERLPEVPLFEQADDDWITDRGYPFLVTYDYGDVGIESFWSKTGFSDCEAPVTHWRPLPEPPKGDRV